MDHGVKPLRYLESMGNRNKRMENYKVICTRMITGWIDGGGGRQLRKKENSLGFQVPNGKVLLCKCHFRVKFILCTLSFCHSFFLSSWAQKICGTARKTKPSLHGISSANFGRCSGGQKYLRGLSGP